MITTPERVVVAHNHRWLGVLIVGFCAKSPSAPVIVPLKAAKKFLERADQELHDPNISCRNVSTLQRTLDESFEFWGIQALAEGVEHDHDTLEIAHFVGEWLITRVWDNKIALNPRTAFQEISRALLNVVFSIANSGAIMHSAVWQAVILTSDTSPSQLWHLLTTVWCDLRQAPAEYYFNCLHGFGHGALRRFLPGHESQCRLVGHTLRASHANLSDAIEVCKAAPSKQLAAGCAGGVFHSLHERCSHVDMTSLPEASVCINHSFPASCFIRYWQRRLELGLWEVTKVTDYATECSLSGSLHSSLGCLFGTSSAMFPYFYRRGKTVASWCDELMLSVGSQLSSHASARPVCLTGAFFWSMRSAAYSRSPARQNLTASKWCASVGDANYFELCFRAALVRAPRIVTWSAWRYFFVDELLE